jgi:hypothetical protein
MSLSCVPSRLPSTHEFRYSSFHEGEGSGAAAPPPPPTPPARPRGEAATEASARAADAAGKAESRGEGLGQRIRQRMGEVAAAAEEEAVGAAGGAARDKQARAVPRAQRQKQPPGVLFLNEAEAKVSYIQNPAPRARCQPSCQHGKCANGARTSFRPAAGPADATQSVHCARAVQSTPSGVLHIPEDSLVPESELEAAAQRAAAHDVPLGATALNLAGMADTVADTVVGGVVGGIK